MFVRFILIAFIIFQAPTITFANPFGDSLEAKSQRLLLENYDSLLTTAQLLATQLHLTNNTESPDLRRNLSFYFTQNLFYDFLLSTEYSNAEFSNQFQETFDREFLAALQSTNPMTNGTSIALVSQIYTELQKVSELPLFEMYFENDKELQHVLDQTLLPDWLKLLIRTIFKKCAITHPDNNETKHLFFRKYLNKFSQFEWGHIAFQLFKSIRTTTFTAVDTHWGVLKPELKYGLGVSLAETGNGLEILSSENPLLKEGDIIVSFGDINGGPQYVTNDHLDNLNGYQHVADHLHSIDSQLIQLTVQRDERTLSFNLMRSSARLAKIQTSTNVPRQSDISYPESHVIQLNNLVLEENIYSQTLKQLEQIKNTNSQNVIIDLRGNPGGKLDDTVEFLSSLITQFDSFVTTNSFIPGFDNKTYLRRASNYDFSDFNYIVLIDHNTASAAEIVAGLLQMAGAKVIGASASYGKGSVQNAIDLEATSFKQVFLASEFDPGVQVKLTTHEYLIGESRAKVDNVGIQPDLLVDDISKVDFYEEFSKMNQEPNSNANFCSDEI